MLPPLGAVALLVASGAASAHSVPDFTEIVDNNRSVVVNISTTKQVDGATPPNVEQLPEGHPFRKFFKRFGPQGPQKREQSSLGSGVVISSDGYILTNAHVIQQADEIQVRLADNREFKAEIVGLDKPSDVGLLNIDATGLKAARIGDSDELQVGQWLLAIGSPFGLDYTATQGIVSALERSLPSDTYTPFIQTDVAVNPGNSGGPLFNRDGEVVGINSQIFSRSGGYMGLSFAVPINVAMDNVEQLKQTGGVERGYLGVTIQPVDRGLAESFGLDKPIGALVSDVVPDSPAANAGIDAGDVILQFNGKAIEKAADLPPVVGRTQVGSSAQVEVLREGERQTIEVAVGALSDYRDTGSSGASASGGSEQASLNISVRELSGDERRELGLGERGLLVERVGPGPVAQSGIQPGDILLKIGGRTLTTVGDLREAIDAMPHGRPVALQIRRGDNVLFVSLTLPEQSE
jgi:serine protease Do